MRIANSLLAVFISLSSIVYSQAPPLHIHFVSHNEPNENLQQQLNYIKAKNNVLNMAHIVDSANVKWNLQTSDGFVFGARHDENVSGTNVFETLAGPPYNDNIQIDPRNKNFPGRNIADQYYLLDSLNANPTKTVGGFVYYVCPPNDNSLIDWWQYTDTLVGSYYGNSVKFDLLSGAGSLEPHCHDLNDFGIFKPNTTADFYTHNPDQTIWCVGVGCAPVLDSLDDEQEIIDLIQGQVDSIQNGLWPWDKFYVTRIMTNQREYGPMFFQKIKNIIAGLNQIPASKLKWSTIGETFAEFQEWQTETEAEYSMWQCGQVYVPFNTLENSSFKATAYPNPAQNILTLKLSPSGNHTVEILSSVGNVVMSQNNFSNHELDISALSAGIYHIRIDNSQSITFIKE
jgi:uncharacterized protein YfkK (UPF0435 family)